MSLGCTQVLLAVPQNVVVTAVMDCDHATTLIDIGGTLDGSLVDGLKYSNFCGLQAHSAKMTLANHERDVWQAPSPFEIDQEGPGF